MDEAEQFREEMAGRPTLEEMDDSYDGPKYGLQVVEVFGDLLELPTEVLSDERLRENFVMDRKAAEGCSE